VLGELEALGMNRGWVQEFSSAEHYRPEFARREDPFNDAGERMCTTSEAQ
jgi:hypothetical protein